MSPLVLAVLVYLFGTALAAVVPFSPPVLSPRQIVPPPPPDANAPVTPLVEPPPAIHTILGIPTVDGTVTLSSTSTSIVPSSTTTRTFTFTPPPQIFTTIAETTVIEETVETVLRTDPTSVPTAAVPSITPAAADTGNSSPPALGPQLNAAVGGRKVVSGGLSGVLLLGVLFLVQPW